MKINKWLGWIQAASPYNVPPGAATEQVNAMSLIPGQLTVRGGMKTIATATRRLMEMWGLSTGPSGTDLVLAFDESGAISEFSGIGSEAKQSILYSGLLADRPVSFCQGRRGEVYIYQGYGQRGLVRGTDGKVRPVGLDAPATKPGITIDSSASYYVARIDITDAGNGYHLPPSVYIGPPPGQSNALSASTGTPTTNNGGLTFDWGVVPNQAGSNTSQYLPDSPAVAPGASGRQAKAICRIGNAQVSEVEVTDGGDGYTSTPCVQFKDQPGLAVTGTGAAAALKLKKGFAQGDPDTGVVFWEVFEMPYYWWVCFDEYEREGNGFIVPATGGKGSGAKAIFMFPDSFWRRYKCPGPDADGTDLTDITVTVQVYDFGTGYQPGDEIVATMHVASSFISGSYSPTGSLGPNCSTTSKCQLKARGYCISDPRCPDMLTIIETNTHKQRQIDPVPANPGKGYMTPPTFTLEDGDVLQTEVDCYGRITKLLLQNPYKTYLFPPKLLNTDGDVGGAKGLAIMRAKFRGKYQCYYRWVNNSVPETSGGPIRSSLSPVNEVDCGDRAAKLTWAIPEKKPQWATAVELWRSTSNQAITLFRVATVSDPTGSIEDKLSDYDLTDVNRTDFEALPILLEDGSLNANRFGVASTDFAVGIVFQDRTFLSVDTTGKRPNTIMYSEADEPESMPETNELILQTNVRDTDHITALIPYAGALLVMQSRHCNRLNFVNSPAIDATTSLVAYRGCMNQRCWDIYLGEVYAFDDFGLYQINEQGQVEHLFAPLDTIIRTTTDKHLPTVDFSKREWFFVRSDRNLGVIRIHVAFEGDPGIFPTRQIVYDPDTKTFWTEEYPTTFSCAAEIRDSSGSVTPIAASESGIVKFSQGLTDDGAPINWSWKSGNLAFVTDESAKGGGQQNPRTVAVLHRTTDEKCLLNLGLYYNNSRIPRANVARRDRGVGFVADEVEPKSSANMQLHKHADGESNGLARAVFAGRSVVDFAGADAHVAVRLFGQQDDSGAVIIHGLEVQGVEGE